MIVHSSESPRHFSSVRGKLILFDPNGHQIAQVENSDVKAYLVSHNLCCEEDLGQTPQMPEHFRYVFDVRYKKILERADDLPTVSLPLLSPTGELSELNSYSSANRKEAISDILLNRLKIALAMYSYVVYSSRTADSDLIGIGRKWREWFLNDIVGRIGNVGVTLPPGIYPSLHGAVVCREKAEPLEDFLKEVPRQHWRDWASKDVLEQIYF